MIIVVNDCQFLNINHIVKASVENDTLRIIFSTGQEQIYFNKNEIEIILDKLKNNKL